MAAQNILNLSDLTQFITGNTNNTNYHFISQIPEYLKDVPCILGIDEAGRGPVLGPMVYGIAFCPMSEASLPDQLGCSDSKTLTEEKRDEIFQKICETPRLGWAVEVIAPNQISNSMLSRQKYSLNQVSMDSAIGLVKLARANGLNLRHIYVDTVGPPEKYQAYLKTIFPDCDVTVAKKADSIYPVVSAASICAKVTRDHCLKVWKFQEGLEGVQFGSGYPGDPVTKSFLRDNVDPVFGFPQLVRFSWSTAGEILKKEAYYMEAEDVEEAPKKDLSVTAFFKMQKPRQTKEMHDFFKKRGLSRNVSL